MRRLGPSPYRAPSRRDPFRLGRATRHGHSAPIVTRNSQPPMAAAAASAEHLRRSLPLGSTSDVRRPLVSPSQVRRLFSRGGLVTQQDIPVTEDTQHGPF